MRRICSTPTGLRGGAHTQGSAGAGQPWASRSNPGGVEDDKWEHFGSGSLGAGARSVSEGAYALAGDTQSLAHASGSHFGRNEGH